MEKENFSPLDSLGLIEKMILQAQNKMSDNGTLYLLWGWVIFTCSVGQYVLLKLTNRPETGYIWFLTFLAAIYQIVYLSRQKKNQRVKSYTEDIINAIWICFGVCMGILTFLMAKSATWIQIYSMVLMMYGVPTLLSGVVMKFKPLVVGGIACWALSIGSSFVQSIEILLLLAAAVLVAWIVPGYLMRQKFKRTIA
jgi:hypothetical protein